MPQPSDFGLTDFDVLHFRSPTDLPAFDAWLDNTAPCAR